MKLFIPSETHPDETRVAVSADVIKKLVAMGIDVSVQKGAGEKSRVPDGVFASAGAQIVPATGGKDADIVLRVRRPEPKVAKTYKKGAVVLATMDPYGAEEDVAAMAKAGLSAFSMEFMPRITRAQVMDVLSSQANLAGYQAVV
ncbi:MAG: NAD(P)(+) transhydrogenase (Re/Si-specific) subunit alpha, partial [Pseudomonadota bacterium]